MTSGHYLYRHFDEDGDLLYVGTSRCAVRRTSQHSSSALWFSLVHRIEIENFDTREAAELAERVAILAENPRHNLRRSNPEAGGSRVALRVKRKMKQELEAYASAAGESLSLLVLKILTDWLHQKQPAQQQPRS